MPVALGRPLPWEQRATIMRTAAALQPLAVLRHFGIAVARGYPAVRLVFNLPRPRLGACLIALGLSRDTRIIVDAVSAVGDGLDSIALQVDVVTALGPRIGVEFHGARAASWQSIFRTLVARGWCSAEHALALATWQGISQETDASAMTSVLPDDPARLREAAPVRLLSHVKLSFDSDSAIAAKAYLYAGFLWR